MLTCVHSPPCSPTTQRVLLLAGQMRVASQVQEASTATSVSIYGRNTEYPRPVIDQYAWLCICDTRIIVYGVVYVRVCIGVLTKTHNLESHGHPLQSSPPLHPPKIPILNNHWYVSVHHIFFYISSLQASLDGLSNRYPSASSLGISLTISSA